MKKKPTKTTKPLGKIRQNVSLDDDVRDLLRKAAKAKKTSVSGLITRWVMESGEFATLRVMEDPKQDSGDKANSSRSGHV